jgi:deoxyribose-phosphate aldolase
MPPLMTDPKRPLARFIDHTLLKPEAGRRAYEQLIVEAAEATFASVCVPPIWVGFAAERLAELGATAVAAGTVVGFPLGYVEPAVRIEESRRAIATGAAELDTVIDLSWLKSGDDARVLDDLAGWVAAARAQRADVVLKVILETCLLDDDEKRRGTEISIAAGADFVKTSTGFSSGGATVADVELLFRVAAGRARIKASGGIRDLATARAMIDAGAERLGTSSGRAILAAAGLG